MQNLKIHETSTFPKNSQSYEKLSFRYRITSKTKKKKKIECVNQVLLCIVIVINAVNSRDNVKLFTKWILIILYSICIDHGLKRSERVLLRGGSEIG